MDREEKREREKERKKERERLRESGDSGLSGFLLRKDQVTLNTSESVAELSFFFLNTGTRKGCSN